jgi:SAM-dependent methyltransferase
MSSPTDFDEYAEAYDAALNRGISLSGEDKEYFARRRIEWLGYCLKFLCECPRRIMDYGCGSGSTTPFFFEVLGAQFVLGLDASAKSLDLARRNYASDQTEFRALDQYRAGEEVDLVYCNGVFHHIAPYERRATLDRIRRCLRPGGLFAFWENNPLNPGTRLVMARIPFDKDAVTLTAREARRLLRAGGFQVLRTDFVFLFPRALKWLRRIEPRISCVPLGAQFQVLCRNPSS